LALRRFVFWAFVAFVATAAAIGVLGRRSPDAMSVPAADPAEREISPAELARHASASDCWLAVAGAVYDVTACVAAHPAPRRAFTAWCGKEATGAFEGAGVGSPHGAASRARLTRRRLGKLAL